MPVRALGAPPRCIDWERGRMLVKSPKTEHHPCGASRCFYAPELRPYPDHASDWREDGQKFVVTGDRLTEANLRTQFTKIVVRAGLEPWPKIFHNLRRHPADRTAGPVPGSRRLRLDRQLRTGRPEELFAGDRGAL